MVAAVTDLVATETSGNPAVELTWNHTGVSLDRFMLGYDAGDGWVNLEPRPAADFGAGPYEITVPSPPGATWRVLALDTDGTVSV